MFVIAVTGRCLAADRSLKTTYSEVGVMEGHALESFTVTYQVLCSCGWKGAKASTEVGINALHEAHAMDSASHPRLSQLVHNQLFQRAYRLQCECKWYANAKTDSGMVALHAAHVVDAQAWDNFIEEDETDVPVPVIDVAK